MSAGTTDVGRRTLQQRIRAPCVSGVSSHRSNVRREDKPEDTPLTQGARKYAHATVLATIAIVTAGCEQPAPPAATEPALRPVRYVRTQAQGGMRYRLFSGAAKAGSETRLSFKVQGTIEELPVNVGDAVRTGDLIARIDPRDYELQAEQAEASLAQGRAQAANAQSDFARTRGLYERENASQGDYDAARAQAESAQASVRAIEKQLEQARLQVSYCELLSPIDGAVAMVDSEVNENVGIGNPIVTINAGIQPEVEVSIPEVLIGDVRQGANIRRVTFDAIPSRTFSATITEVAVAAAEGLTTYPVTIRLHQADRRILPGMAAEVEFAFATGEGRPRHILPRHAVVEDGGGRFVFVVKPSGEGVGVVERRQVTIGELVPSERFRDGLEVLSGLEDGELIVTAGVSKISNGQQVKVFAEGAG